MPDYDAMTKAELADTLEASLLLAQLRDLVRWYVEGPAVGETSPSGGPMGGLTGTPAASNRWDSEP